MKDNANCDEHNYPYIRPKSRQRTKKDDKVRPVSSVNKSKFMIEKSDVNGIHDLTH
jgi:hypothetical protein